MGDSLESLSCALERGWAAEKKGERSRSRAWAAWAEGEASYLLLSHPVRKGMPRRGCYSGANPTVLAHPNNNLTKIQIRSETCTRKYNLSDILKILSEGGIRLNHPELPWAALSTA
jgi:hypothetical protein